MNHNFLLLEAGDRQLGKDGEALPLALALFYTGTLPCSKIRVVHPPPPLGSAGIVVTRLQLLPALLAHTDGPATFAINDRLVWPKS